jgi:carboxypeptidase family protein/molybdopterin-dependent oxidoreductase-like protein protein
MASSRSAPRPFKESALLTQVCRLRYPCAMRAPKNYFRVLLCAFLIAALAAAQQAKTPVTIVVTDPNGALIPHAQVRLTPAPDPPPAAMETDEKGKLRIDLLPGEYALSVSRAGFKRSDSNIVVKQATDGQTITVSLEVGENRNIGQISVTSDPEILLTAPGHDFLKLSATQLKALPHVSVTIHNPHTNADESYSGVRLSDVLAKLGAPLGQLLHGTALKTYVVATGSDRYQAVFSLAEVDPTFHPGEILVADSINGVPLDAKTGPFRLVVTEDKRPARSVRNLVSIELKSAE